MKKISFFTFIMVSVGFFAQDKTKDTIFDFKNVQIGINFSPDICFRTLKNVDGSSTSDLILKLNNDNETFKVGYTSGLNFNVNFNKNIALETGIQYSNKGYETKTSNLIFSQSNPILPEKMKFRYNFHYIDIPVKVNFTIGKKRARFFTSIGLTTNILLKETSTSVLIYSEHIEKFSNTTNFEYKKMNFSPTISIGTDYKINPRMNVRIEPTFRYGVLKINDDPITAYLFNCGLNMSFYYGL